MRNYSVPGLLLALIATGLMPTGAALAANNTCEWNVGTGPISYLVDMGGLYIPRDAKNGDMIGAPHAFFLGGGGHQVICRNDGSVVLNFNADAAVGRLPDDLLETNIPGVGARIVFDDPFNGQPENSWKLRDPDGTVPFSAYIDEPLPFGRPFSVLGGTISLVKTGPIDMGRKTLDSSKVMVTGSFTALPNALSLSLAGSVTRAECTLSTLPVSADPVPLGNWSTSTFTGKGYTTDPRPFFITLNACVSDSNPGGTVTNAYIRLDPVNGSATVNPDLGLFSLGAGSTASGIGIQVLNEDASTPLELEEDNLYGAIPAAGGMLLNLHARFYQTGDEVNPGEANGALSFTITYK